VAAEPRFANRSGCPPETTALTRPAGAVGALINDMLTKFAGGAMTLGVLPLE
jgi:hypothetical protein